MRRVVLALVLLLGACAPPALFGRPAAPAVSSAASPAEGPRVMVSAANPLAAEAGLAVLRRGGSAVDAAAAVQAVLSLVEPQSSGLGGGAFMMVYEAKSGRVFAYDGRETAPKGARPDMFLGVDGRPLPFAEAVVSGDAVGTPGVPALLAKAHARHGRLPWRTLFADAERLAEEGFVVSERLAGFVARDFPQTREPDVRAYFAGAEGRPVRAGERLRNPAYAAALRRLAAQGPRGFYEGETAREIVAAAGRGARPGTLSAADLKAYRVNTPEPLCRPYRVWLVCTMPPPSSGAALLQALAMLETRPETGRGADSPEAWFVQIEALRLMYADRDRWVADPAFVRVPVEGLLDPAYVRGRAALIGERFGPAPRPGLPPGAPVAGEDATNEPAGTSHFVIVDAEGNAVSMTTTVESVFGSGRMAAGMVLNNQMTDFAFSPVDAQGRPAANAVAPGKRPRSSMSPVVVLDADRRLVGVWGSPGGTNILAYNLKTTVGVLDWGLSMQAAIDLPNVIGRGADVYGEADKLPLVVREGLAARGTVVQGGRGEGSGLHGIVVRDGRLDGGADPRREGVVRAY